MWVLCRCYVDSSITSVSISLTKGIAKGHHFPGKGVQSCSVGVAPKRIEHSARALPHAANNYPPMGR